MTITVVKKSFSLCNKRILDMLNRIEGLNVFVDSHLGIIKVRFKGNLLFTFKPDRIKGRYIVYPHQKLFIPSKHYSVSENELVQAVLNKRVKIN
ncbi:hypothetical protein G3M81_23130 [Bacillus paralicheniformis]|uniref:hypothetical protein n=1 Tax=Bacillus TaxID=1386 RepID=UPI0013EE994B|nr:MULTISPECIES: hypothetical protein [Bacillus]QII26986.1 hypothetical protein G3M80_21040 [Bacillus altitudinis]QII51454.1 hypothetical protein G3M81_23130 [Bacillus paralicheniformis]